MLMIRFQRTGRTNDPAFRIVVLEKERAAQAGNIVEKLGTYNPRSKALTLDAEAVKGWIAKGAQPTDSIRNLLITKGVIEGKKVNVIPKRILEKKPEPAPTEAEVVAEAVPVEPTPEAGSPTESIGEVVAEAVPAEPTPAPMSEIGVPTESIGAEEKTPVA